MSVASDQLRFAVLHHTGYGPEHYDLLIETSPEAPLATWRLSRWPPIVPMPATRQADHRRIYLDYQGPIPGNRGCVTRISGGTCHLIRHNAVQIIVQLPDHLLRLRHLSGDEWRLHP